jgi:hypothetical protein
MRRGQIPPDSRRARYLRQLLLGKFDQRAAYSDCIYGTIMEKCAVILPGGIILIERLYLSFRVERLSLAAALKIVVKWPWSFYGVRKK